MNILNKRIFFQANTNVCQLRLDFNTFNIAQPSMAIDSSGVFNAHPYTDRSVCTNDQFIVTSPGNPTPPVICGENSLQHSESFDYGVFLPLGREVL